LTLVLFMKSSFLRLGIDPMPQEMGYEMERVARMSAFESQ